MRFAIVMGLALVGGLLLAGKGYAADVKVGDPAPAFESVDDQGKPWKSSDVVGKKVVVVYFYPADLTGGCTKQACGFRDHSKELQAKGVEVVGVSGDTVKNHQIFKDVHKLNFTLLADEKGEVAEKFGVPFVKGAKDFKTKDAAQKDVTLTRSGTAERWTIIIGKDGKIAQKTKVANAADDPKHVLEAVEKLAK